MPGWGRRAAGPALLAAIGLLVSGCGRAEVARGWLPTDRNTTNQTSRIMTMLNGSWIAALTVGVLVWGLMRSGVNPSINALASLLLFSLICLVLVSTLSGRRRSG